MQHFSALVAGASMSKRSRVINSARRRKSAKFENYKNTSSNAGSFADVLLRALCRKSIKLMY
jgi:hypothetical protein